MQPRLLVTLLLTIQGDPASELAELRARADTILEQRDAREITMEQGRRQVQLLLKNLVRWADDHGARLEVRSRTYTEEELDPADPLAVDRCQLFYEETGESLCPLDLRRSELWSGTVLFCRFLCE